MSKSADELVGELCDRVRNAGGGEVSWKTQGVALHGVRRESQLLLTVTVLDTTSETARTRAFAAVFEGIEGSECCIYGPVPHESLEDSAWRIQYFVPRV
jgi:hypothetical protein